MKFPVKRIAEERTVRLVASADKRSSVLLKLVDTEDQKNDLEEIEGATSGRLQAQKRGTDEIDPQELAAVVPHAHFINAAFSYPRPGTLNRFNKPGRGAWYAALRTETCLQEVIFHMNRELGYIKKYNTVVDYIEMYASFAGHFVDLRDQEPLPECLHPNPDVGYPAGNALAEETRQAGHNGIIYPSVRHKGGTCFVVLQPKAVQSVAKGDILRVVWSGTPNPQVTKVGKV